MSDVDATRAVFEHAAYRGLVNTFTQLTDLDHAIPGVVVCSDIPIFYRWAVSINATTVSVGGFALEAKGTLSSGYRVRVIVSLPAEVLRLVGDQNQVVPLQQLLRVEPFRRWEQAKKTIPEHDKAFEKKHGRDWRNPRRSA